MKSCPNRCFREEDIEVVQISGDTHACCWDGYQVTCNVCHMSGPLGGSEQHAIKLWDELPRAGEQASFLDQALNEGDGVYRP